MSTVQRPVSTPRPPAAKLPDEPLRREPSQNTIRDLLDRLNQLLNLNDFSRGDVFRD